LIIVSAIKQEHVGQENISAAIFLSYIFLLAETTIKAKKSA
jgi:hypothetical protein